MIRAPSSFTPASDLQSFAGHEAALANLPGGRRTHSRMIAQGRSPKRPLRLFVCPDNRVQTPVAGSLCVLPSIPFHVSRSPSRPFQ